ncbi:MAG TPA: membrane dipeptidase [Steroidobacteraceae bacterium]|nr:membrane dipeptidase [Steroidobacteraceae bacterium]
MTDLRTALGGRGGARAGAVLAACSLLLSSTAVWGADPPQPADGRIDRVLAQTPLVDGHNDLPWEIRERFGGDLAKIDLSVDTVALPAPEGSPPLMTDIPRLRRGRVGAQFWSVFIPVEVKGPQAVQQTLEQIDLVKALCARYPHDLAMAYSAADIIRLHRAHLVASLIGVEGPSVRGCAQRVPPRVRPSRRSMRRRSPRRARVRVARAALLARAEGAI